MIGLLYLQAGTAKLLHFPVVPAFASLPVGSLPWLGGIFELLCGTLIVLGLFTRPVALIASGESAAAYFVAHAPRGFFPILNGGSLAAAYCFAFLYLAVAGGGAWSLDGVLFGHRDAPVPERPRAFCVKVESGIPMNRGL
jgi:putative oxidoreductase